MIALEVREISKSAKETSGLSIDYLELELGRCYWHTNKDHLHRNLIRLSAPDVFAQKDSGTLRKDNVRFQTYSFHI